MNHFYHFLSIKGRNMKYTMKYVNKIHFVTNGKGVVRSPNPLVSWDIPGFLKMDVSTQHALAGSNDILLHFILFMYNENCLVNWTLAFHNQVKSTSTYTADLNLILIGHFLHMTNILVYNWSVSAPGLNLWVAIKEELYWILSFSSNLTLLSVA